MSPTSATDATVVAEVLAAEEERCRACAAGDWRVLDGLLHENLVYTHLDGKTQNKAVYFADLQTKQRQVLRTRLKVHPYGDLAVMTGGMAYGDATVPDRIALQVWAKADDRWQIVAFQSTPLAERRLADHLAG